VVGKENMDKRIVRTGIGAAQEERTVVGKGNAQCQKELRVIPGE
jgi:hypothetical protein